jgi:hypothetical protein
MGSHRHAFRFKVGPKDESKVVTFWAKVKPGKRDIYLTLAADDVRRAIKLGGVGTTDTCTMAVCAKRQRDQFPHSVEGYVDWFYSRAFVVSKCDKNGMPVECYEYMHNDSIAKLNDTRGGQKKLLAQLEAKGDRIIHLLPVKRYDHHTRRSPPKGVGDGSRTKVIRSKGAALRFAAAQMGGVAA